jgi:hypothetical protein
MKLHAHKVGPFDKSHGSELVEELPGGKFRSYRAPSCLPVSRDPAGHVPVKSSRLYCPRLERYGRILGLDFFFNFE